MGHYLNPGNEGFKRTLRARIYVDKSEMIEYVNSVLGTDFHTHPVLQQLLSLVREQ